jgi:hypothetical protein
MVGSSSTKWWVLSAFLSFLSAFQQKSSCGFFHSYPVLSIFRPLLQNGGFFLRFLSELSTFWLGVDFSLSTKWWHLSTKPWEISTV